MRSPQRPNKGCPGRSARGRFPSSGKAGPGYTGFLMSLAGLRNDKGRGAGSGASNRARVGVGSVGRSTRGRQQSGRGDILERTQIAVLGSVLWLSPKHPWTSVGTRRKFPKMTHFRGESAKLRICQRTRVSQSDALLACGSDLQLPAQRCEPPPWSSRSRRKARPALASRAASAPHRGCRHRHCQRRCRSLLGHSSFSRS